MALSLFLLTNITQLLHFLYESLKLLGFGLNSIFFLNYDGQKLSMLDIFSILHSCQI